jgi:hypothetical protein
MPAYSAVNIPDQTIDTELVTITLEGIGESENATTSSGIEPATFRLVE